MFGLRDVRSISKFLTDGNDTDGEAIPGFDLLPWHGPLEKTLRTKDLGRLLAQPPKLLRSILGYPYKISTIVVNIRT
jgi:hypothetical protein